MKFLQKFGFGKDFIRWISIILKNQEPCVINGGTTTNYFKLERGTRQGDPISAYLVLEIVFFMIKNNDRIKGLELFNHTFLYTAYADDTTFFLKNKGSVLEVMKTFQMFSEYSGLRLNTTKCEIAGLGGLKGVKTALCGMVCIDLTKETIKILGIHYSYNKHIQVEKKFYDHVKAIETVLKAWRMRNLTLQGKITIFKTLAISKLVHLALVLPVIFGITCNSVIKELNKIQQNFIWSGKNSKIKHGTLCNDYENGGLKNVDIESKMISLRCLWVKRLYDESFHEWKVIPNYLITKALGDNFLFHSNLKFNNFFRNSLKSTLPIFYQDLFTNWSKNLCSPVMLPSAIASQFLWHNRFIEIDGKTIFWSNFSENNINFVGKLFQNGKLKSWSILKVENGLHEKQKF